MPVCNQRRYLGNSWLYNQQIFYVNDRVTHGNTATRYDRRIQRNRCHYSYSVQSLLFSRIAVHPTIRPRSEYEANIRYSRYKKASSVPVVFDLTFSGSAPTFNLLPGNRCTMNRKYESRCPRSRGVLAVPRILPISR